MFVVFDLESTGLSATSNDIIEFAYIMFDSNNMFVKSETLYFYYDGMSWSEEAYQVHRIPLDFLKQFKDQFKENCIKMYSILNRANVCGHNALRFDCPFVKTWLMRQGIKGLEFGVIQDTMTAFKPITHKSQIKLSKLLGVMGISDEEIRALMPIWFNGAEATRAHEASYDVVGTALLALRGIERNLIAFEPLVKLNTEISQDDVNSIYAAGTAITLGANDYIVCISNTSEELRWSAVMHNDNGTFKEVSTSSGVTDLVNTAVTQKKLLPVIFKVTTEQDVFEGDSDSVVYRLTCNGATSYELTLISPVLTISNDKFYISNIVSGSFTDEYVESFVKRVKDTMEGT